MTSKLKKDKEVALDEERSTKPTEFVQTPSRVAPAGRKPATEWKDMIKLWPKTTFLIVANELCERFSYYGMRTILSLYATNILLFSDNKATTLVSAFIALCYYTPILGSIIADGYIGKFKTILVMSVFYACGQIFLALSATLKPGSPFHPYTDILALSIIALGTGGIKPCVAPFGGDQFVPWQTRMISVFFSMFYFSINAGSVISTYLTPLLRQKACLGQDSCYPLAFGVPTVLLLTAIAFFVTGFRWYLKPRPATNIFKEVYLIIKKALRNKRRSTQKQDHWLDHYTLTHSCKDDSECKRTREVHRVDNLCAKRKKVNDVKRLFRLWVIFTPGILFWFCYDQQASKWVQQAINMDCRLWKGFILLPDQTQVVNAVLILVFIPLFQLFYSLAEKCVKVTAMRKMVLGIFLASIALFASSAIQFFVNRDLPMLPPKGQAYVSIVNSMSECSITPVTESKNWKKLAPKTALQATYAQNDFLQLKAGSNTVKLQFDGNGCTVGSRDLTANFKEGVISYIHVNDAGHFVTEPSAAKPKGGNGEFSLAVTLAFQEANSTDYLVLCKDDKPDPSQNDKFVPFTKFKEVTTETFVGSSFTAKVFEANEVRGGKWAVYLMGKDALDRDGQVDKSKAAQHLTSTGIIFEQENQGGVYVFSFNGDKSKFGNFTEFRVVDDNHVNVAWQMPQLFIITAAEILFSVTSMEFAFTESAPSMKAIVQASYLLTTALGDTLLAVINAINVFSNQGVEYAVYGVMMLLDAALLAALAIWFYDSDPYSEEEEDLKYTEIKRADNDKNDNRASIPLPALPSTADTQSEVPLSTNTKSETEHDKNK